MQTNDYLIENLLNKGLMKNIYVFMKIIALMSKITCVSKKILIVSIINVRLKLLDAMPESYLFYFDTKHFRLLG